MAHRYKAELGSSLVNFARVVPHGMLVFFPSSAALRSAYEAWERPGPDGAASVVARLSKHKTVITHQHMLGTPWESRIVSCCFHVVIMDCELLFPRGDHGL